MYRLHGFFTQNTLKTLYVLEELGVEYEYVFVDLVRGANRTDEFRAMTPVGKVPVLEHENGTLFESGAICRFVASDAKSPLYPADKLERAKVDQWMTFFTCHPGRWLTELYFEKIMKPAAGLGETNLEHCAQAERFVTAQLKAVERHLAEREWLANGVMSIAEPFALAYLEQAARVGYDLSVFPRVNNWFERIDQRPAASRIREMVRPYAEAVMG